MIKLEHNIFHKRGIVAFAVEASTINDIPTLDLFAEALMDKPDINVGFVSSTRLIIQVSGMRKDLFETGEG